MVSCIKVVLETVLTGVKVSIERYSVEAQVFRPLFHAITMQIHHLLVMKVSKMRGITVQMVTTRLLWFDLDVRSRFRKPIEMVSVINYNSGVNLIYSI